MLLLMVLFMLPKLKIDYVPIKRKYYFFTGFVLLSLISLIKASGLSSYVEFAHIATGYIFIILFHNFINDRSAIKKISVVTEIVIIFLSVHLVASRMLNIDSDDFYSNVNRMTTFLVFYSPIFFSRILSKKNIIYNYSMILLVSSTCFIVGSRFNLLTLVVQVFLCILILLKKKKIKQKKFVIVSIIIICSVIFVPILKIISANKGDDLSSQMYDPASSLLQRAYLLSEGLRIIKESHFLGVGAGNIRIRNYWTGNVIEYSLHNFFVHLTATYGIIALILFIFMYVRLFYDYKFLKKKSVSFNTNSYEVALILFLISFIISSGAPSSLFKLRPFYFIFAYHFAYIKIFRNELEKKIEMRINEI